MNFSDALGLMRSGIPVRRTSWKPGYSLRVSVDDEGVESLEQKLEPRHVLPYTIGGQDLFTDDWTRYGEAL